MFDAKSGWATWLSEYPAALQVFEWRVLLSFYHFIIFIHPTRYLFSLRSNSRLSAPLIVENTSLLVLSFTYQNRMIFRPWSGRCSRTLFRNICGSEGRDIWNGGYNSSCIELDSCVRHPMLHLISDCLFLLFYKCSRCHRAYSYIYGYDFLVKSNLNVNLFSNTVDKSIFILVITMEFCEEIYPLSNSSQGFIRVVCRNNWKLA